MKHHLYILIALFVMSCAGHREDDEGKERPTAATSLTRRAWEMRRDGVPLDSIIAVQRQAVAELRGGTSSDDPVEVLEQMGYLYYIAGEYPEAVRYYREAVDSMYARPVDERGDGAIQLFGDMASVYSYLGMMDRAIEFNDSALAESRRQDGAMLSDVYRFRAGIYEMDDNVDEAVRCYDRALYAIENGRTREDKDVLRAMALGEKAHLVLLAYPEVRDSVDRAVRTLERTMTYDGYDDADRIYALGLGYALQNRYDKGIPLLEKAAAEYSRQEDVERVHVAYTALLREYAASGMNDRLAALVPRYLESADSVKHVEREQAVAAAVVRYDMQAAEDNNRILALRLEVEREKRMIIYGVAVALLLALVACVVIFRQRTRLLNQKRLLQEKKLEGLNRSNDKLKQHVDVLEKDLSAGMNSNGTILSSPQLITGAEEGRFRRAFNVLYPDFITELKHEYPRLTANDELLCMLIYLRHTTDEVSVYLGISRASVNSARYRLRTKFALTKEQDLDCFLTGRRG